MEITHIHSSSKYNRSPATLKAAVYNYIKFASIVTFTEVEYESREKVLRSIPGWGCATGDISPRNDAGIIWDNKIWKKIAEGNEVVAKVAAPGQHKVAATWAVLEHRVTGKRITVIAVHAPSSVEGANGFLRTARVTAWWSAVKGLRALWMRLAKQYNTDGLLVAGDWNVNIKKAVFRAAFKATFPSLSLVWSGKDFPAGGTHGNRIIDFSLIRGVLRRKSNPRLFQDDISSDHRPYIEDLTLAA